MHTIQLQIPENKSDRLNMFDSLAVALEVDFQVISWHLGFYQPEVAIGKSDILGVETIFIVSGSNGRTGSLKIVTVANDGSTSTTTLEQWYPPRFSDFRKSQGIGLSRDDLEVAYDLYCETQWYEWMNGKVASMKLY